jgi:hypothetical protein
MENKIITILFILLLIIGLTGCGVKQIKPTEDSKPNFLQSVGKMEGIGLALGCMFAPQDCEDIVQNKKEKDAKK